MSTSANKRGEVECAKEHNLKYEVLDSKQIRERFPVFEVSEGWSGFYEESAGFVVPEWAIPAYADIARKNGAELHENVQVVDWSIENDKVIVYTSNSQKFIGDKLVLTAGARIKALAKLDDLKIQVTRQVLWWLDAPKNSPVDTLPIWALQLPEGILHGVPRMPHGYLPGP